MKIRVRFRLSYILLAIFLIVATVGCYYLLTFLVEDVAHVENTYIRATYEALGTALVMLAVLVIFLIIFYRRDARDIRTLTEAIRSVSDGNYTTKIKVKKRDRMAPVYERFNRMCAELDSVQILRNDFINRYAHEFKTPLASINGFASLILENDLPEEERRQYLEIIRDESERLAKMGTNSILMSRLSAQQIITDAVDYALDEQLRECAIILSGKWMAKQIEFSGDFEAVTYHGNREIMQQIWLNLLDNAVKYTPKGGEILMSLKKTETGLEGVVKDNGIGMSKETAAHLFEPYYQARDAGSEGMGLGLAIVHRIVELCSGSIEVESREGEGTAVTVRL